MFAIFLLKWKNIKLKSTFQGFVNAVEKPLVLWGKG